MCVLLACVQVYIESRVREKDRDTGVLCEAVRYGRVLFVDLAGSENLKTSGTSDSVTLKETGSINKSLFTLGSVISTLGDVSTGKKPKNAFVPFRNSKLTMLLMDR